MAQLVFQTTCEAEDGLAKYMSIKGKTFPHSNPDFLPFTNSQEKERRPIAESLGRDTIGFDR